MALALYEHNQKAYHSALAMMEEAGRAAVIHPTGTGKSFLAFKLALPQPLSRSTAVRKPPKERSARPDRQYHLSDLCPSDGKSGSAFADTSRLYYPG